MGRYWITEHIGEGATGAIFGGEYGALRRPVAIKILHKHLVGDSSASRMLSEARTLSMLDHPGIVKVFDSGTVRGRAFIVMERLVGESLCARLQHTRLSEDRVVTFARQLTSAMETAHAVGIIHRDLKPENVFIVHDPEVSGGERVKIIDFGIAKRHDSEATATGIVLGTPNYMAPEQWHREADPRVDIYSLGVLLYVMATGELPFTGNTNELLAEHAYCAPPKACELAGISSWLSSIIERCLAKRPEDRFPTMGALGAALYELECAIAPPTGPLPRTHTHNDDWDLYDDDEDEATIAAPRARGTGPKQALDLASEELEAPLARAAIRGTNQNDRRYPAVPSSHGRLWTALRQVPRWPLAVVAVLTSLMLVQPRASLLPRPQRAEAAPARIIKMRWVDDRESQRVEEPRRSQRKVRADVRR
jgi:serine/threonine protein kinase